MLKTIARTVLIAATLVAGSLGLSSAPAAAETVRVTIGSGPNIVVAQRYERRGVCNPRQALRKADRMGLNRARIVRDNRRAVVVDGRKRGRIVTVRFAQERGCPVIGVRD